MDKPEWCPQDIWDYVLDEVGPIGVHVYRISYKMVCERIARAILSAQSQAYIDAAKIAREVVEPYTTVSTLHNYGPGGLSRVEEAEIRTGQFIMMDLDAAFAAILQRKEEIGR